MKMTKRHDKCLHPRNLHNDRYDFEALIKSEPKLAPFVRWNPYGDLSIDFAVPDAVLVLNKALQLQWREVRERATVTALKGIRKRLTEIETL